MASPRPAGLTPSVLRLIRLALAGGLVITGAAFWFVASGGTVAPMGEEALRAMNLVFLALLATAIAALLLLQRAWRAAPTQERRGTLTLVAWSVAEGIALFGAVLMLLGGGPLRFLAGLLLFGVALLLFPVAPSGT
jgi:FtsH-binding integral membrane protein